MLLIISLNNYTQKYYSSYPKMCLVELTFLTNVCWINWIVTGSLFWWYLHCISSLEHCFFFFTIIFLCLINLFWMCHVTRGILVPWPWIEPGPPVLGAQSIKTTGSRGKSRSPDFWALSWNPQVVAIQPFGYWACLSGTVTLEPRPWPYLQPAWPWGWPDPTFSERAGGGFLQFLPFLISWVCPLLVTSQSTEVSPVWPFLWWVSLVIFVCCFVGEEAHFPEE